MTTETAHTAPGGPTPVARPVWARLIRDYALPHRGRIILAIASMLVVTVATLAQTWLLGRALGDFQSQVNLDNFAWVLPAILAVTAVGAAGNYLQATQIAHVGQRIVAEIQVHLFERLMHADLARMTGTHSGQFTSSFLYDVQRVRESVSDGLTNIFKNAAMVIGLIIMVFVLDWVIGLMAVAILPLLGHQLRRIGKRSRKAARQGMAETGTMSTLISESLDGIRVVKSYGQEAREIERLSASAERRFRALMKAARARAISSPVAEMLIAVGMVVVLYYSYNEIAAGRMNGTEFFTILFAVMRCYQPLKSLAGIYPRITEGLAAAERIYAAMDVKAEIADDAGAGALSVPEGRVTLDAVDFHYPDGTKALTDCTIEAPPGRTVALVGPSGAGKSTVLNLIPRFYDVSKGSVRIDGQDVRRVTLKSLRNAIALVTQEPFLFDDTIRANISYGRPGASEAEIEDAARNAAAHEFIMQLPHGYETLAGEQGVRLSGGQRQRIAIARALLADTPILLLDEATSALDSESERQVQQALERLMRGRTTIVIAHRFSTIVGADRIYVLDGGRVVEQGSHGELLNKRGLYASLYTHQGPGALRLVDDSAGSAAQ